MKLILILLALNCNSTLGDDVLFLGNSYTMVNDLPRLVRRMSVDAGKNIFVDDHAEGGWSWQDVRKS